MLALIAMVAGCKAMSIYTMGPPRRVQIEKQSSEPSILAEGVRDADGGVVVRVLELREVRVTRRVQHGALELRVEHPGHPGWLWELVEFPMAAFMTVVLPVMLAWNITDMAGNKPGVKRGPFRPFLVMLNPFAVFMAGEGRVYVSDVTFDDPPRMRQFNVRLPVGELALRYRVLDAGRDAIASGEITTDQFGKLRIPEVPPHAVGIELVGKRVNLIAPIESAPPSAAPAVPAPPEPAP